MLKDAHRYIFGFFLVKKEDNGIHLRDKQYLGTGFFVSPYGDAITAGHVIPEPSEIPSDKSVIAIICKGENFYPCWVNQVLINPTCDLALVKINELETPFLPVSFDKTMAGSDVVMIGYPDHELYQGGKELRIFKGHVTLSHQKLDINIPIPSGMSGCPVFCGNKVIGFASGSNTTESIEEATEELLQIDNNRERIVITQVKRMVHYGIVWPFSSLSTLIEPGLNNRTLKQFIEQQVSGA